MFKNLNIKTIVQALSVLQKELDELNYMTLIKHIFFSDRYHLRHFGFLYTFDNYCALKFGAVPSTTKDIVTKSSFLEAQVSKNDLDYINKTITSKSKYEIIISETSENYLSDSVREALQFSINTFNKFNQYELGFITHDYPEWKVYKDFFQVNQDGCKQMCDLLFFDNPDPKEQPFIDKYLNGEDPFKEDQDFLDIMKEEYSSISLKC